MKIYFGAGSLVNAKYLVGWGVKNILFSYYYVRKSFPRWEEILGLCKQNGVELVLDSGVFSLMNEVGVGPAARAHKGKGSPSSIEGYLLEYMGWIEKWRNEFRWYVELDLDYVLGVEETYKLNQRMFDRGLNPVRVFHSPRGLEEWKRMCREAPIVATEGSVTQHHDHTVDFFSMLLELAGDTKVHAFAFTAFPKLKYLNFDSVDSLSWRLYGAYGYIIFPDGKRVAVTKESANPQAKNHEGSIWVLSPGDREELVSRIEAEGFDMGDLNSNSYERSRYSVYSMLKLEEGLNKNYTVEIPRYHSLLDL